MKPSGIGGQAVMEGVMMKNKEKYAVAVRKPNQEIVVDVQNYGSKERGKRLRSIPFIRGVFNFWDSLYLGTKVLTYSASFFEEEEADLESAKEEEKTVKEGWWKRNQEDLFMILTVCFSLILSIGIFFCVPYFLTIFIREHVTQKEWMIAIIEGVLRIGIFLIYMILISFMKDIQRFFMYHGAEHKCINCIENGWELNIENARKASRQHKRCGTSFLLIVMVISVIFLFFIRVENRLLGMLVRLALIPVIAGISYEFIRLAGRSENSLICFLSKPGMWLQKLTTREPEDEMLEVAIRSVEAVFDWRVFLQDSELEAMETKKQTTSANSSSAVGEI